MAPTLPTQAIHCRRICGRWTSSIRADSVCLPGTCPPSQPAPRPAASLSPLLSAEPCKLGAPVGMCSHPSHLTSELHVSLMRTAAAQSDPFQEFSSGVLNGPYFPCVIVICALMTTINRSLIIPRFLLIQ